MFLLITPCNFNYELWPFQVTIQLLSLQRWCSLIAGYTHIHIHACVCVCVSTCMCVYPCVHMSLCIYNTQNVPSKHKYKFHIVEMMHLYRDLLNIIVYKIMIFKKNFMLLSLLFFLFNAIIIIIFASGNIRATLECSKCCTE